jgi:hypothetical protein
MVQRRTYQLGIVGEANYQPAIRRCSVGQHVHIVHEPRNPYDGLALAVVTEDGDTIGYVARDCWLRGAVHDEGKGCDATIKSIGSGDGGKLGVVLDLRLSPDRVGERAFRGAPASAQTFSQRTTTKTARKGWLARLLNL